MESIEIAQSTSDANVQSSEATEAEQLFDQFIACEPGPEFNELRLLIGINGLPKKKVAAAIIAHPDFDINCRPLNILLQHENILDVWELLPIDQADEDTTLSALERLPKNNAYQHIRHGLGRHLIALGQKIDKVCLLVPELQPEAWEKLIQLEEHEAELVMAVQYFQGDDQKQKILWILEHKPSCAYAFVTSEYAEVANSASRLTLGQERLFPDLLSRIICAGEKKRVQPETARLAIDRLLNMAAELAGSSSLLTIIQANSATELQKERASDVIIARGGDTHSLRAIIARVPSRKTLAESALEHLDEAIAAREAARPLKDRLYEQLLNL